MFFSFVMIMFQMVFVCVCAVILFLIVKNISTWNKNNHSPKLTVSATVVAKRTQVLSSNMQMRGILQVPMVLAQPPQLPTM